MSKQKIIYEINKTKEHLANLEKILEEYEYKRWEPKNGEEYFYVDNVGIVQNALFDNTMGYHLTLCKNYNCFQTREQAEQEAEKILVRRQLEDIARRLNKGREIDWSDENQYKWYIVYNTTFGFATYSVSENTTQGVVYCLDKNFLNTAIKEIGEGRLMKYLRGK